MAFLNTWDLVKHLRMVLKTLHWERAHLQQEFNAREAGEVKAFKQNDALHANN